MSWRPRFAARPEAGRTHFCVWAPATTSVDVVASEERSAGRSLAPERGPDGTFHGSSPAFRPGDLYGYVLDGDGPFPDPASRYQPEGVHGPSQVIDPGGFSWSDSAWRGLLRNELVIYERRVGTLSRTLLHWIHENHMDSLRLDATHAMVNDGPRHFLADLSARVFTDHKPELGDRVRKRGLRQFRSDRAFLAVQFAIPQGVASRRRGRDRSVVSPGSR